MTPDDPHGNVVYLWRSGVGIVKLALSPDELEQLSGLIGSIYDCVIDPRRWDEVLDEIRRSLRCANCVLSVADMQRSVIRSQKSVGIDPYWQAQMEHYSADITALYSVVPDMLTRSLDEPFVMRRDVPPPIIEANRYYREWGVPNGIIDAIQVFLIRTPERNAALALGRHKSAGPITDQEVRLLRLLAPHLRRAITISDLIDMADLQAVALGSTLDVLTVAVLIVGRDGRILHVNERARRMLALGKFIRSQQGLLRTGDRAGSARLKQAIAIAATSEAAIGACGLGTMLEGSTGEIAIAHVLPLRRGELRIRFPGHATAAVFVATEEEAFVGSLELIAEAFGLTAGELRLLGRLMLGETIDEAAIALGVARTTAKTHLSRVLTKTGMHRHTSLLALIHRRAMHQFG
jgi:DNA-binding CsgD family transcriptional regulator/PAS domain-containing protein